MEDSNSPDFLRKICCEAIKADPEFYNEGFLGSPNEVYQNWILNSNNWGGKQN
jgi:hypothetical protein